MVVRRTRKVKKKVLSAKEIIQAQYKGKPNIMTPQAIGYGKINESTAYELSSGRGIVSDKLYGVTVVKQTSTGTKPAYNLSKAFTNKTKAQAYIAKLKKRKKKPVLKYKVRRKK